MAIAEGEIIEDFRLLYECDVNNILEVTATTVTGRHCLYSCHFHIHLHIGKVTVV